jgi:ribosomal protein L12E/L44/L45/RPP1/RPP2
LTATRWQAKKPYLGLLSPAKVKKPVATESSTSASDSESIDDDNWAEEDEENAVSETEESHNLQSEHQEEPYILEKCTVEVHLTFKPDDGHPDGRIVIISASSHRDFPVSEKIRESSLGELPPPLKELLKELVADFPNCQVRRQIANARNQKKRSANQKKPGSEASSTTTSTTSTESKTTGTQLTLFGI